MAAGQSFQFIDRADRQVENARIGPAKECDFFHMTLDMPLRVRALSEQDHIAGAIASRWQSVALQHDRSLQDHDRLVNIIVPVELAFTARPDHRPGGTTRAL